MSQLRLVLSVLLAASIITVLTVTTTPTRAQAPTGAQGQVPGGANSAPSARTVQDGVFTDAQAARGATLYAQRCAGCHGPTLTGGQAPPLEGAAFRFKWRQEPLSALFIKIRYTMPPQPLDTPTVQRPTAEQGADLVAHLLKGNGFPAGKTEFAAADAVTSAIGWPTPPAGEAAATIAAKYPPTGHLNQLMRGVFFPNSNLIFTVQEMDPEKMPPQPPPSRPDGLTIFDWGQQIYTGWPVVENAATALADASTLMTIPGLRCENGKLAPITEPDWIRFTDQMVSVARRTLRLAQSRDKDAVSEYTETLSDTCNACHRTYRDVGGRGRGANALAGSGAARCTHR
jgi:S-disulfanyl-L-cysteine oxidoreductase SoxD